MQTGDLPVSLIHADLVTPNVVAQPRDEGSEYDKWTVVDWAGAGVGPRILSLAFLAAVASPWRPAGSMGLINAVVKGYLSAGAKLEPCELDERLPLFVCARHLVIRCWEVAVGRTTAVDVVAGLPKLFEVGQKVAARMREVIAAEGQ
jgi:Ser/Thr protein kinase RdoA (MazF antagonist)